MMLWQEWWVWLAGGVALAILEMLAPGFILLGFSIGALVVGILLWVGILGTGLPALLLVFALASLAAWFGLRTFFGVRRGQLKVWNDDINED